MFTRNQTLAINGYFNMVNKVLSSLFCAINPDNTDVMTFPINNEIINISTLNGGLIFEFLEDGRETISISFDSNVKHIYISEFGHVSLLVDNDGDILDLTINDCSSKDFESAILLKVFNNIISLIKEMLNVLLKDICDEYNIGDFLIDNFVIAERFCEEKLENKTNDNDLKILAAALIYKGQLTLGNNHFDCAKNMKQQRYTVDLSGDDEYKSCTSGYITTTGEFVSEELAWLIAQSNNLIEENVQCFTKNSEDFYKVCKLHFDIPEAKKRVKLLFANNGKFILSRKRTNKNVAG